MVFVHYLMPEFDNSKTARVLSRAFVATKNVSLVLKNEIVDGFIERLF